MPILVTEQLGPTQSLTPEGYLLCAGVPIARIGSQIYAAHELPSLKGGTDGLITVIREESEVFSPETVASFEGKSVTVHHQFVDPSNVKRVEVGHAQNVRRCESERDLLIADLLIKDERAIDLVRFDPDQPNKKLLREISCGYDAEYVQSAPGVAYQRNIIGNHIALVERGRAGPRCSIQDTDEEVMSATTKKPVSGILAKLLRAIRTGDNALSARMADEAEKELERIEDEEAEEAEKAEKKQTADSIAALAKTVDGLAAQVASLVAAKTVDDDEGLDDNGQPKKKTEDDDEDPSDEEKQQTADAMRDTASRAEILVPGFSMPTADSAPKRLADVATVQRKVLSDAMKTADGKAIISPMLGARTVDAMTADAVSTLFVAASEVAREKNNGKGARTSMQRTGDFSRAITAADINKRNAEFYANQKTF